MPEGPEIHREALRIAQNVGLNQKLVWQCDYPPILGDFKNMAGDAVIESVDAYGKAIVINFSHKKSIYSHNQLYGKWLFSDDKNASRFRNSTRRFRLKSDLGWAELYSATTISWHDTALVMQHPYINRLGPDAVNTKTELSEILNQVNSPRFAKKTLHSLLLDQSFIAGVGNYLRSEIIFKCSFNPLKRLCDISDLEKELLAKNTLMLCRQTFNKPGVTIDLEMHDWIKKNGAYTQADKRFWVFNRENKACWLCSDVIRRIELSGRRLYVCPTCQNI